MAVPFYKQFAFPRLVFCAAFAAASLVSTPASAQQVVRTNGAVPPAVTGGAASAAAASPYTVEGVEVDVTAKNAVMAREKALMEAQVKAYRILAERSLPPEQMATFRSPDANAVSLLVQDFEVTNEQLSTKRYKGTYTIRFRPNAVRGQMGSQGRPYAAVPQQRPVLVLPFFQVGAAQALWSPNNPWMAAWRASPAGGYQSPVIVPSGDAQDMSYLNEEMGLDADPSLIASLAQRYNAGEAIFAVASPPQGAMGAQTLTVDLYALGIEGPVFLQKAVVQARAGEPDRMLYARAVDDVKARLRQMPHGAPSVSGAVAPQTTVYNASPVSPYPQQPARAALGPAKTYSAIARFGSVQEWVRIKGALDKMYGMQGVMIKTLKPREAALDLRFAGDGRALQSALSSSGLGMRTGYGGDIEIFAAGQR